MWKGKLKKWAAAVMAAVVLGTGVPAVEVSAASGGYSQVDMFAQATSIKGLQGASGSEFGGVQHTLENVNITPCIYAPDSWAVNTINPETNRYYIEPYMFKGKPYYFSVGSLEEHLDKYINKNISVSVVFTLEWEPEGLAVQNGDLSYLYDENSRDPGHKYYALATTGEGGETFKAFWHFFMEECIRRGWRVDNFILGNEVNAYEQWNYSRRQDDRVIANKYADAFYSMWSAVREYTNVSRCSISLDHSWQNTSESHASIKAKDFLDMFASRVAELGRQDGYDDVDWCVSAHLYPAQLNNTRIWRDNTGMNLNARDPSARIVDGRNLSVMTDYIRTTYGEQHRVMLTEQGFCSNQGQAAQAASLAYTYYAAKYDPMVDCFILFSKDESNVKDGLNFDIRGTRAEEVYTRIDDEGFQQQIADWCLTEIGVKSWEEIIPNFGQEMEKFKPVEPPDLELVQEFVTRLYTVCLGRTPDEGGFEEWTGILMSRRRTGSQVAYGFVFSDEFRNMNLCNEHYVTYLYRSMMGREPDTDGLADWINRLETGATREAVFNGFVGSQEFTNMCEEYGIKRGNSVPEPEYGTIPTGACSIDSRQDGVTAFVERLYKVCLGRDADDAGRADWCGQLWNRQNSGRGVAFGFVFSDEFKNMNLDNEQFVEYMYLAFFDRGSDPDGKADWLNRMQNEWSREQVFDGFAGSQEFDNLCKRYGIVRE